jgi:hypothetical protein
MKENLDPVLIGDMEEKIRKTLEKYLEKIVLNKYPKVQSVKVFTNGSPGDSIISYDIGLMIKYSDLLEMEKDIKDDVKKMAKQALLLFWSPDVYRYIGVIQYYD